MATSFPRNFTMFSAFMLRFDNMTASSSSQRSIHYLVTQYFALKSYSQLNQRSKTQSPQPYNVPFPLLLLVSFPEFVSICQTYFCDHNWYPPPSSQHHWPAPWCIVIVSMCHHLFGFSLPPPLCCSQTQCSDKIQLKDERETAIIFHIV